MDFAFNAAEEAFREEVRDFLGRASVDRDDPQRSRGLKGGYSAAFYRELGRQGLLGIQIAPHYGGRGLGPIFELIFAEQLGLAGAPAGNYAGTVLEFGSLLVRHGTEQQRRAWLPRITAGEIRVGHLYTEPEAGSDLAAQRTRAVRDGGEYVVNGLKTFASEVNRADYSVLMARTRAEGPAEQAISLFILDHRAPGVSHTPMATLGGKGTYQAYLDDVRIPVANRIGPENGGWDAFLDIRLEYWTKQQGYYCGTLQRLLDDLVAWLRAEAPGRANDRLVRQRIARIAMDVESVRWLSYDLATTSEPQREVRRIAALKVLTDSVLLRVADEATRVVGRASLEQSTPESGSFATTLENRYRENVLKHFSSLGHSYARTVLAVDGLGLPAS